MFAFFVASRARFGGGGGILHGGVPVLRRIFAFFAVPRARFGGGGGISHGGVPILRRIFAFFVAHRARFCRGAVVFRVGDAFFLRCVEDMVFCGGHFALPKAQNRFRFRLLSRGRCAPPTPSGEGDYRGRGSFIFFFSFRSVGSVLRRGAFVLGEDFRGVFCVRCAVRAFRRRVVVRIGFGCAAGLGGFVRAFVVGTAGGAFAHTARTLLVAASPWPAAAHQVGHVLQHRGGESVRLAVDEKEVEIFHHVAQARFGLLKLKGQRFVVERRGEVGAVAQVREHHHVETETGTTHLAA